MKTIGLIGGMSWESTQLYYQKMNQLVQQKEGQLSSASIALASVNFQDILKLQEQNKWHEIGEILANHARNLEQIGADAIVLCTNTMHKLAPMIEKEINIPFLHIVDVLAQQLKKQGICKVGVLGTAFTMQEPFYQEKLMQHNIQMLVPNEEDRKVVHDIIYNELCKGQVKASSQKQYIEISEGLIDQGAQAIILGCTEIVLLMGNVNLTVPTFDTTQLHAEAAIDFALA